MQPPQSHRVSRKAQVGFRLPSTSRKEQQVSDGSLILAAVEVAEPRNARQVEQDEGDLKGIPCPIGRHINFLIKVRLTAPTYLLGVERVRALEPHGPVHESERLRRLFVFFQQLQSGLDTVKVLAALLDRLGGGVSVVGQLILVDADVGRLLIDPILVGGKERLQFGA